jgi:hypothetical protein
MNAQRWKRAEQQHNKPGIVYNYFFLGIIPLCFDQKGNYFIIKK